MHIPLIDDAFAPLLILPLIDSGISSAINGANSAFRVGLIIGPGGSETICYGTSYAVITWSLFYWKFIEKRHTRVRVETACGIAWFRSIISSHSTRSITCHINPGPIIINFLKLLYKHARQSRPSQFYLRFIDGNWNRNYPWNQLHRGHPQLFSAGQV